MARVPHALFVAALVHLPLVPSLHAGGIPDPANCIVPTHIDLVGVTGAADPAGTFFVHVRDTFNQPVAFAPIQIDFDQCDDVVLSSVQPFPGSGVDCFLERITGTTDTGGTATFSIVGGVRTRSPASFPGCAEIRAHGILIGTPSVAVFDQDGLDGVTANDLALWQCDRDSPGYEPRSDYNHDGMVSDLDLPFIRSVMEQGASLQSGPRCDGAPHEAVVDSAGGGLTLRWNDCPPLGAKLETFACDAEGGESELVATLSTPADDFTMSGFMASLIVEGDVGVPLADWWRFDDIGCRSPGALDLRLTSAASGCTHPWGAGGQTSFAVMKRVSGGASTAEILVVAADPVGRLVEGGRDITLFRLAIPHDALGACSGCDESIAIRLDRVELTEAASCAAPPFAALPVRRVHAAPAHFESNVALFQGAPSGVTVGIDPPRLDSCRLVAVPNPASRRVELHAAMRRAGTVHLDVFDVTGRQVRRLGAFHRAAGPFVAAWDGRDDRGRAVVSGIYLVRLRVEGDVRWGRVVLLP